MVRADDVIFEAIHQNYRHRLNRYRVNTSMTIPDPEIPVPLPKMTGAMAINSWFLRGFWLWRERERERPDSQTREWTLVNSSVWNSETDNRQSRPKTDAARVQYSRDAQRQGWQGRRNAEHARCVFTVHRPPDKGLPCVSSIVGGMVEYRATWWNCLDKVNRNKIN